MNDFEINDIRNDKQFKGITFSKFKIKLIIKELRPAIHKINTEVCFIVNLHCRLFYFGICVTCLCIIAIRDLFILYLYINILVRVTIPHVALWLLIVILI